MAKTYLIDGYNVVHRSSKLRSLVGRDLDAARTLLLDKVMPFCIDGGHRVTVVFDAPGGREQPRTETVANVPNLEVVYASGHLTADAIIERRVYEAPNRMEVVVVSNDRGVRDLCRGLGALTMGADHFIDSLRESRRDLDYSLERTRKPAPNHLQDRLNEDALDRLLRLKDQL